MAEFDGTVGRDWRDSTPAWPEPVRAPEGAPNVVLLVLDDVGFAQLGCYGSPIATPNMDALAAGGVRFNRFHTTALCSPTRACLLTGRNHHSVGMGRITQLATGYPGYNGLLDKSSGMLSEVLVREGWATYAVGKWHLTPETEQGAGSPKTRWPLGRGFERYYGFMGGATEQFAPELVEDNHPIDPPGTYEDGYHLTADLTDHAITYLSDLRASAPGRPFFLYFCTGAGHAPHQVHPEWIERYRGQFDDGWDAYRERALAKQIELGLVPNDTRLSDRPAWVPAWDDVPDEHKPLFARYMECFAGFMSHTDAQIGRLVEYLRDTGDLDNTIFLLVSDNGASSEGGRDGSLNELRDWNMVGHDINDALAVIDQLGTPRFHNNYPWGWTMAGNTPFQRWKREVHQGGIADPFIVHWPAGLSDRDTIRNQFVHAIDIMPTVLELLGVDAPAHIDGEEQRPIEGTSFAYALRDAAAAEQHDTQYFEMFGSRAIYHQGWKAVTYKPLGPTYGDGIDPNAPFDDDEWELYHTAADFSESTNVAADHPDKVDELHELWWSEASKYHVLPLDNRVVEAILSPKPQIYREPDRYEYRPNGARVPAPVAVDVRNRSHTITAEVEIPDGGAEGVLLALGTVLGGFSFFVQDQHLHYVHNLAGMRRYRVGAHTPITPGAHTFTFAFEKTPGPGGIGRLYVDDTLVGEGEIKRFTPVAFGGDLHCGRDPMIPCTDDYRQPFAFTGTLHRVIVDVRGEPHRDGPMELKKALADQ
ncbi:MAG: sulfatase-like hydrolase/transferase [Acidimicrobiia bacterium]